MANLWLLAVVVATAVAQNALDIESDTASIAFGVDRDVVLSRVGPGTLKLDGTLHVTGDLTAGSSPASAAFDSTLAQMNLLAGWTRLVVDPYSISCSGGGGGGEATLLSEDCDCRCSFGPDRNKTWDIMSAGPPVPQELLLNEEGVPGPGFEPVATASVYYPRTVVMAARIRTNGNPGVGMLILRREDATPVGFVLKPTTEWQVVRFYPDPTTFRVSSTILDFGLASTDPKNPMAVVNLVFYTEADQQPQLNFA